MYTHVDSGNMILLGQDPPKTVEKEEPIQIESSVDELEIEVEDTTEDGLIGAFKLTPADQI